MDEGENPQNTLASRIDFELDERYKTEYAAYDTDENELVTAHECMFGKAKGHNLLPLKDAIGYIRENLDKSIKTGILKTENTEGVLLDIRQALNTCDQAKNKALRDAETSIKDLIKALYERKEVVISSINEYFTNERKKIEEQEHHWREKQTITENLLKISANINDDETLLENSKYIAEGMKTLKQQPKFDRYELINSLDTSMHVVDHDGNKIADITHEELKRLINEYITPNETKKVQYRC